MEKTNEISCVHPFAISDHAFQTLKASIVDRKLSHKDLNEFKFQSRKQVTDIVRLIEANNEFGAKKVKEVSIGKRQSHLVSYGCENYDSATYSCSFRRSAKQSRTAQGIFWSFCEREDHPENLEHSQYCIGVVTVRAKTLADIVLANDPNVSTNLKKLSIADVNSIRTKHGLSFGGPQNSTKEKNYASVQLCRIKKCIVDATEGEQIQELHS